MRLATGQLATNVRRDWLIAGALAVLTYVVFAPAIGYGFVNCDDDDYVYANKHVLDGLNANDVRWAFTSGDRLWIPLTWLSFQLDVTLWGTEPWGFHLTNVLVHAANVALLFLALRALTGTFGTSAAVALLFAVHPLRVESVAWVTERKDVLSAFFGLLALWAYAGYVAAPSVRRYLPVALALALSMSAKPMLVTLPCLFLLLDWWPLGRVRGPRDWPRLGAEKLPLFALAAALAAVTYLAQVGNRGVMSFPLTARFENAAISYVEYLKRTVWPVDLAVFYPHRYYAWGAGLSLPVVAGAIVFLTIVTAAAIRLRQRAPYLLAGWLWYVGTLVPVIGVVQNGEQSYADRFSYFPQVGILIAVCWGVADMARAWPRPAVAATALTALLLSGVTRQQLPVWKDSETLWRHDLRTVGDNPQAHLALGGALYRQGKLEEAAKELVKTRRLQPSVPRVRAEYGLVLYALGRLDEAEREQEAAIDVAPKLPEPHRNLGQIALKKGQVDRAVHEYREALRLSNGSFDAHLGLGVALKLQGALDEAMQHLQAAINLEPRSEQAYFQLGQALEAKRDAEGAATCYERAVQLQPAMARDWYALSNVRRQQGRTQDADQCLARARQLDPALAKPASKPGPGNPPPP
jgi:tetratricopeptide (TPR) repeat protein